MEIVISQRSDTPIYEQIRTQLAAQILDGRLEPDQALPSIRSVARELGISVITIKKAWELLEADDLIYTRAGKGAYVADHANDLLTAKRRDFAVKRFRENIPFYREMAVTKAELQQIVEDEY